MIPICTLPTCRCTRPRKTWRWCSPASVPSCPRVFFVHPTASVAASASSAWSRSTYARRSLTLSTTNCCQVYNKYGCMLNKDELVNFPWVNVEKSHCIVIGKKRNGQITPMSLCGNTAEWCETINILACICKVAVLLGLMSVLLKQHFTLHAMQYFYIVQELTRLHCYIY